ncbi:MAG: polysaccharide deacetylase family protein [Syntrophomonas sp.]
MKVYFLPQKKIYFGGAALLILGVFLASSLFYFRSEPAALKVGAPVYQGNSGQKAVALTVNVDWGEEFIPGMLKLFKENDAQVTFFVTGKWAEKNSEMLKKMKEAGHSIQNHGYKHLHFNSLSSEQASEQIKKAEDVIYKSVGEKSRFFAPPYGEQNQQLSNITAAMDYELILWSIDTVDWKRPAPATIVNRVISKVHNDAIILMHPTEPTVKALPDMLKNLKEQGYKMQSIDKIVINKSKDLVTNEKSH